MTNLKAKNKHGITFKNKKRNLIKNQNFQQRKKLLPRLPGTNRIDPKALVDLMLDIYPQLFEALFKN